MSCKWRDIQDGDFMNISAEDIDRYQTCSCNEHLWSVRAKKVMKISDDLSFMITSVRGERYMIFANYKYKYLHMPTVPETTTTMRTRAIQFLFTTCFFVGLYFGLANEKNDFFMFKDSLIQYYIALYHEVLRQLSEYVIYFRK